MKKYVLRQLVTAEKLIPHGNLSFHHTIQNTVKMFIFSALALNVIESEWRLNSALRSEAFVKGNGTNKDFLNFFCKKFMFLKTMSKKILLLQNEIVKGFDLRLNNSIRLTRLPLEKL